MKYLVCFLFFSFSVTGWGQVKKIHTIYANIESAEIYWSEGRYAGPPVTTEIESISTQARDAWQAAIGWMVNNALEAGEIPNGRLIISYKRNAAVATTEMQQIDGELVEVPTSFRHVLLASVPVIRNDGLMRQAPVSSEEMPPPLRDALLSIIAATEASLNQG